MRKILLICLTLILCSCSTKTIEAERLGYNLATYKSATLTIYQTNEKHEWEKLLSYDYEIKDNTYLSFSMNLNKGKKYIIKSKCL